MVLAFDALFRSTISFWAGLKPAAGRSLTVEQLLSDYGFPALWPFKKLYGIAGNPVRQSLSPRLHNAGYRAINYPALFVPFHVECFEDFRREMLEDVSLSSLGISFQGVTIVSPYKEVAMAAAKPKQSYSAEGGFDKYFCAQEWQLGSGHHRSLKASLS